MGDWRELTGEMGSVATRLMSIVRPHGFVIAEVFPLTSKSMGSWWFIAESEEFQIVAGRERGGPITVEVASRVRRKPRAHMRGPWALSQLRGFREGKPDHLNFANVEEEMLWLERHLESILVTSFLNCDELQEWAVKASRRRDGQDHR